MHEQLEKHAPGFHRALTEYPRGRPQGLEETFFWVNFRIEDKPSTALVHRMFLLQGDVQVFSQRYFYVSRHYNSVQTTGGAFPVERGSVLLVEHRVSTDRVAGFGMTERQQLETQLLAGEFTAQLERFRRGEATSAGSE